MTDMPPVFISYSEQDRSIAESICEGIEAKGIRCWIAPRDVMPGTSWPAAIEKAIQASKLMVLVLSSHSNSSVQVVREVSSAVGQGVYIIAFRVEDISPSGAMNYFVSATHWLDALTSPLGDHISRLVSEINRRLAQE